MRGRFQDQSRLFSYLSLETRVPSNHPLRKVRELVREVLKELSPSSGKLYSRDGRPWVGFSRALNRKASSVQHASQFGFEVRRETGKE